MPAAQAWALLSCCGGRGGVHVRDCGGAFNGDFTDDTDNADRLCIDSDRVPDCGDTPAEQLWVVPDDVIRAMGSLPLTQADRAWLELCTRAANSLIRRLRPDLPLPLRGGEYTKTFTHQFNEQDRCLDPMVQYGAIQLCLEMYRRRGMVQGENATQFGDFGPPPTSLSYEAQMFLRIGRHQSPVVA